MKIGYLVPEFPGQTHIFFWREVCALRGMGVEVVLLSTRRPAAGMASHEFAQPAARETSYLFPPDIPAAVRVILEHPLRTLKAIGFVLARGVGPAKERLVLLALIACAASLAGHARRNSIGHIHCHSCARAAHLVALCRILGGPSYSLSLHGDLCVYGRGHAGKMAGASFVAVVTRALQDQVRDRVGLEAEALPVIMMGVETDRFRDVGARDPSPGRLHLVTVARLEPCKGYLHAVRAVRAAVDQGVDVSYTIVGDGSHRAAVEGMIRELGLASRVEMLGMLPESDVLPLLRRADAFLLPSVGLGEAAPVAVMEAMSCGMAVICSIIGGTPDMITDGIDGLLVEQADESAIAAAIVRLARDIDERSRLGEAARRRAVACFDSWLGARKLLDYLDPGHPARRDRRARVLPDRETVRHPLAGTAGG